ncbi:MAG: DUF1203 domain-containing protein [Hyphomicrobiales bacterium]|nr:DUF1203 domain-containing protein [Hyphomicrobiales bacterium]MBV9112545.1 DUF1203 domain-containing protein [Hyphomicrobiales bacterium]MBV9519319.1 DUF1203 domain-containing protein [Hyphomicrobiales bacterium]
MGFRISALPASDFRPLFTMSDEELAARGALRIVVDKYPGYPCRVSLTDAKIGEVVLLTNYEHQTASSPYRASHAIFVRENAQEAYPQINEVPPALRSRLLSMRAFDEQGMMIDADVVDGHEIEPVIERMLANSRISYLHVHNAKPGCYAARVDRA